MADTPAQCPMSGAVATDGAAQCPAAAAAAAAPAAAKPAAAPVPRAAGWLPFGDAYISCVVFADGGDGGAPSGRALRHPRGAPIADLIAAAGAKLQIGNPR